MPITEPVLALDIGGTKVAGAAIESDGNILYRTEQPTSLENGVDGFLNSVSKVAESVLNAQKCSHIGIASAGPLDPISGQLIQPTNIKGQDGWGTIELTQHLEKSVGLNCTLENDAACAILGEQWLGSAKNFESAMVMTLGTGVGIGVISSNKLVRLRNMFHPEASHFSLNFTDTLAKCGCGNNGCVEAYLGAKNFTRYTNERWGLKCKNGKELSDLARSKNSAEATEAFAFYGEVMAQALCAYAVLFAPEIVIFSGGFSHSVDLFQSKTESLLEKLLESRRDGLDFLPKLTVSTMQEDVGLLGAARVAQKAPDRF